ncbi:hypothetical protein KBD71_03115, partial [Candidatus Woesebacteria bacterium]|nr:hypothetical protein [Candidatus Woesebacteria bacterium]
GRGGSIPLLGTQTMGDEKPRPQIVIRREDVLALQPKAEKLVITAADLNPRAAKYPVEILQQSPPLHPFESDPLRTMLEDDYGISAEQIQKVTKPQISNNPDDLEIWESQQIVGRRENLPYESDEGYLVRILYEESFSVNQNPGQWVVLHLSSAGLTPGGLLSHFTYSGPLDEFMKIIATAPSGNTLEEAYKQWMTDPATGEKITDPDRIRKIENDCIQLADAIIRITQSRDQMRGFGFNAQNGFSIVERLAGRSKAKKKSTTNGVEEERLQDHTPEIHATIKTHLVPDDLNSVGFRVIRLLVITPEFLAPIKDQAFLKKLGVIHSNPVTVMQAHAMVWDRCQSLFGFVGSGRAMGEQEKKALQLLLEMRFHPEFQVFYRFFSPSGYLSEVNENGEEKELPSVS